MKNYSLLWLQRVNFCTGLVAWFSCMFSWLCSVLSHDPLRVLVAISHLISPSKEAPLPFPWIGLDVQQAGCRTACAVLVESAGKDGEIPGSGTWLFWGVNLDCSQKCWPHVRWGPGGVVLGGTPWGALRLHRSEVCVSKEGTGAKALLWHSWWRGSFITSLFKTIVYILGSKGHIYSERALYK